MNDSEQYHTGRAAAYATMEAFLTRILREHRGDVPREAVEALRLQAQRWQIEAEATADANHNVIDLPTGRQGAAAPRG